MKPEDAPKRLSRWQGGKAQFVDGHAYLLPLPSRGGRAFDNFCGSCVVSFWYLARGYRVVIGDTNARLIGCLRNLRERPEAVIGTLAAEASAYTDAKDQREDFYTRRGHLNRLAPESLEASALFLFVLRAGRQYNPARLRVDSSQGFMPAERPSSARLHCRWKTA